MSQKYQNAHLNAHLDREQRYFSSSPQHLSSLYTARISDLPHQLSMVGGTFLALQDTTESI